MPKAISVAPSLPKDLIGADGVTVTITEARIVRDQWTTIGTMKYGLGLVIEFNEDEYSQLFTLDKPVLTGSAGRLMVDVGLTEYTEKISDEDVQRFVGKQYKVMNRGGKLYWYAPKG